MALGPSPPQRRSPWIHTSRFRRLAPRAASGTYTAVVEPLFRLLIEHSLPFVAASGAQTAASPRPYCGGHCADLLPVRMYINGLLIVHWRRECDLGAPRHSSIQVSVLPLRQFRMRNSRRLISHVMEGDRPSRIASAL